jgi:hypothetical protein
MKTFIYSFDPKCGINILEKKQISNDEFFMRGNAKNVEVGDIFTNIGKDWPSLECTKVEIRNSRGVFIPKENAINNYFEGYFKPVID